MDLFCSCSQGMDVSYCSSQASMDDTAWLLIHSHDAAAVRRAGEWNKTNKLELFLLLGNIMNYGNQTHFGIAATRLANNGG